MLRTVHEQEGTPEDAIQKLIEVKKEHKAVSKYNPCLICRILDDKLLNDTIELCKMYNLRYINITTEDFDMSDLCKDDNKYDVIFNKFKIVEGIDISLKTDDVAVLRAMVEKITNLSYEDDDGKEIKIVSVSDLLAAPIQFAPLMNEILAECNKALNESEINEKN